MLSLVVKTSCHSPEANAKDSAADYSNFFLAKLLSFTSAESVLLGMEFIGPGQHWLTCLVLFWINCGLAQLFFSGCHTSSSWCECSICNKQHAQSMHHIHYVGNLSQLRNSQDVGRTQRRRRCKWVGYTKERAKTFLLRRLLQHLK